MNELTPQLIARIEELYAAMEDDYAKVAQALQLTCQGCPDNCCDSYFLHHTYIEWAYLCHGVSKLSPEVASRVLARAEDAVRRHDEAIRQKEWPQVLCPLNEDGLCILYPFRLMVCRTHGVPATMRRPDGKIQTFPGCFRCQQLVTEHSVKDLPVMDRTILLQRLVQLEQDFLDNKRHLYPKVRLTIAQMLIQGPPAISR